MRPFLSIIFLLLTHLAFSSQPWMDYSMNYFKIKVHKTGIYRISSSTINSELSAEGFNAQSIDSVKWTLFFRGKEIPVFYDQGDIYFYGQRNDGTLDTALYFEGGLLNPYLNLFSDTCVYFLSWYTDSRNGLRMQEINNSNPVQTNYHFERREWKPASYRYEPGENYNSNNSSSLLLGSFQPGEGWTGAFSTSTMSVTFDSLNNLFLSGPDPFLQLLFTREGKSGNSMDISIGNNPSRIWKSGVGTGSPGSYAIEDEILLSDIQNNQVSINANIISGAFSPTHGIVHYPQTTNMYGRVQKTFLLDSGISPELTFNVKDLAISSVNDAIAFDISDENAPIRADVGFNSSLNELSIGVSSAQSIRRKVILSSKSNVMDVNQMSYRTYSDLSAPDEDFMMIYPGIFDSAVQAYFDYRKSPAGGGFNPLKLEVEEVFDQFSFGERSPAGIREFCRYMHHNSTADDKYLFLIGKAFYFVQGVRINNVNYIYRFNPEKFTYTDLVPTFGYPGGDFPYVMNFDPSNRNKVAFGVGRITALNEQQVFSYLEKVKQFENPANNGLWRKRILHMSGGISDAEISRFYGYMEQFRDIAEGPFLGGKVQTISKTEPAGVQTILIDSVINRGISLLTMYGHSSVQFTDIEIGDVNDPNLNYNNGNGQFPMFLINGCRTGNIFGPFESWAQNWVNEPNKGAILFMAHSFEGYDPILKFYSEQFYLTAFKDSLYFGKPVGDILVRSTKRFSDVYTQFYGKFIQSQIELMTLQGDPALRLSSGSGLADYSVVENGIRAQSFDGSRISSNTDSFQLVIPLENYGILTDEIIDVLVERINPAGRVFDTIQINSFGYSDTVFCTVYNSPDNLLLGGLNEYRIYLDPANKLLEADRSNNNAIFELLLPVQTVRNVSPMDFGIAGNRNLRLVSTALLPENVNNIVYQFELDTSYLFNSPFKRTYQYSSGNTGIWDVDLLQNNDSLVYYWRSKRLEDTIWSSSSFTYIENSTSGWSQREFGQFVKNEFFDGLEIDSSDRKFKFLDFSSDIDVRFAGQKGNYSDTLYVKIGTSLLRSNNSSSELRRCPGNCFLAIRISGQTGQPYRDIPWYSAGCGIQPYGIRYISNTLIAQDTNRNSLMSFITGTRSDDYVILIAQGFVNFNTLSPALRDTMEVFGLDSALWDDMARTEPFFFLGKRNWSGSFYLRGDTNQAVAVDSQVFDLNYVLTEFYRFGTMQSRDIGPAQEWKTLFNIIESSGSDKTRLNLFGLRNNGSEELVLSNVTNTLSDLSFIDETEFPKLRLKIYKEDTLDRSSPSLRSWTVLFNGSAEGILDAEAFGDDYYSNIELQEGDTLELSFSFRNISEFDFGDSLNVNFSIGENISSTTRIEGPASGDSIIFNYRIATTGMNGEQTLRVFVNPFEVNELFYDNNIMEVPFRIFEDETPPLVSASFDGKSIVNGDVVAFDTRIRMRLSDENPYFRIIDSASIFYELYYRQNFIDSLINIETQYVRWYPESDTSDFNLIIEPDSLIDGTYVLEFNGRDASGNLAGAFPKTIEFEVQSALPSQIEGLNLYPNPFNGIFNMSFNLKGKDLPSEFFVSIFDLSGSLQVRRDLKNQIKLGDNRLEIWDGRNYRDQRVAGGMYIYKIELKTSSPESILKSPIIGKVLFNP